MPVSSHSEVFQQLQDKYRCLECDPAGKRWCYISKVPGISKIHHARLDVEHLSNWATAICDKVAVIYHAPRTPEFDEVILAPLLNRYYKWHQSDFEENSSVTTNQFNNSSNFVTKEVHHYHDSRKRRSPLTDSDSSPVKRRKRAKKPEQSLFSSPLRSPDISANVSLEIGSLSPFQKWCKTVYLPQWTKCDEVFNKLREEDIDYDTFVKSVQGEKLPERLQRLCSGLKPATAERLATAFRKFITSEQISQS